MLEFCEPGDSYSVAWVGGGFSRCFLEVVGSIATAGLLFLLGLSGIVLRPKKQKSSPSLPLPHALFLEALLCLLLAITYTADLAVKGVLRITGERIYGYTIVVDALGIVSWLFALGMVYRERGRIVRRLPHGVSVVLFWIMNALWLCLQVVSWGNAHWWWRLHNKVDIADLVLFVAKVLLVIILITVGVIRPLFLKRRRYNLLVNADKEEEDVEEHNKERQERREGSFVQKRTASAFSDFWHKSKVIFPYIWPRGHPLLQLRVVVCFLLLASGRVVNVYVPIYYKKIVNALTPHGNSTSHLDAALGLTHSPTGITLPLASIMIYVLLRFLQGGSVGSMGLVNNLRSFLWIRVQQYTTRAMQVDLFTHLHALSLRWHLGRKTGEVLRVMDRGTQSINNLLSYILFNIVPTLVDIGIAVIYFVIAFDAWFGLIVFVTMMAYILFTINITEWRTKFRRDMNERDNATRAKAVDSLLNFETVKYYGAESYEVNRFNTAIVSYQEAEWKSLVSLNMLNSGQNVIINVGLLLGATLCAYRVTQGILNVGDFVLYCTYIVQLYAPLNYFGTYYRLIQAAFVDMENVFDLFEVELEVRDAPDAQPIQMQGGRIEFKNVYFHYQPEKPILKDVSFVVEEGKTLALVGPSGAGKSTIIRLLFRFYDIQDGVIAIDGQDLTAVTQASVRQGIGVVPQDTVLFNDDIRYNVRYGKTEASDEEVERAARYADIHQRILSFPSRYDTVVGERGLKLSGGEKQRVAIARTILKAPAIILLDEATSALDTETERNIQSSLMQVCQDRTTVIVAHRLSTVIHADQILVLRDGEICERGTHRQLLERNGAYASMWQQQQRSLEQKGAGPDSGQEGESQL